MKSYVSLIDAWKRNGESPETFHIPSTSQLMALKPGDLVKIGVEIPQPVANPIVGRWGPKELQAERFFVRIVSLVPAPIVATVEQTDMLLSPAHGIRHGDTITFQPCNILRIGAPE